MLIAAISRQEEPMSTDIKATARKLMEDVWNNRNLEAIDEVIDVWYKYHDPNTPDLGQGPQSYKTRVALYTTAFPDLRFSIAEIFADGDSVVIRWEGSGTFRGPLQGIAPTGKAGSGPGMNILHFRNGKVVEEFCVWDALGLFRQLGVIPAAAAGQAA
jgi:predicted ester cyclase